ncbi:Protein kinase C-binding protein NELL1 [Liparis tanakae]|uniref:Protein kinase C-binding protein NELL1 n=1 Tax=Liparis tanakae TaxID=230148 RepID=A0A4Z2GAT2_9TELE|nr:Protein kinase C-binding protein NELL1 [Liparis tanakae]
MEMRITRRKPARYVTSSVGPPGAKPEMRSKDSQLRVLTPPHYQHLSAGIYLLVRRRVRRAPRRISAPCVLSPLGGLGFLRRDSGERRSVCWTRGTRHEEEREASTRRGGGIHLVEAKNVDECGVQTHTCWNDSVCVNLPGGYDCVCAAGPGCGADCPQEEEVRRNGEDWRPGFDRCAVCSCKVGRRPRGP